MIIMKFKIFGIRSNIAVDDLSPPTASLTFMIAAEMLDVLSLLCLASKLSASL